MESLYDVMELPPDADAKTIKTQYKKLSLKRHPDKGGSTEQMAELNKANTVLSDEKRRERYDRLGEDVEEDDEEGEKKMVEDIKATLDPLFQYLVRIALGSVYIIGIQFFWVHCLITIGGIAFVVTATEPSVNIHIGVLVLLGWINRQTWWLGLLVEMFILWMLLFSSPDAYTIIVGGLISLFVAWWFSGRILYYIVADVILGLLYLAFYMVLMMTVMANKAAAEARLARFVSNIKPRIRQLKKRNKDLEAENASLKEKLERKL
mmetsp:Transcript_6982/g.10649  ORF Transcript_6982/g.10649 Transcript_6982/m.10649 type:complete len:264 (+) Transcript_6982:18-809(+)